MKEKLKHAPCNIILGHQIDASWLQLLIFGIGFQPMWFYRERLLAGAKCTTGFVCEVLICAKYVSCCGLADFNSIVLLIYIYIYIYPSYTLVSTQSLLHVSQYYFLCFAAVPYPKAFPYLFHHRATVQHFSNWL